MSEHPSFDRAKGFVALPVEVLEIDLSPGAFRLLVELCRMANADGFCWPSLDQLSTRMGRSRAAISGYVKSLRDAGLVSTETQKTANGYNYRLKYRVTFWQKWRASMSGVTVKKPERSVQPAERMSKTQKQNHINQDPAKAVDDLDQILKRWGKCFKGAPYPLTSEQPSLDLLDTTKTILAQPEPAKIISTDIHAGLAAIWSGLNVEIVPQEIEQQTAVVRTLAMGTGEFDSFSALIQRQWKPHWRRLPTIEQFRSWAEKAAAGTRGQQITLLRSYQKRWEVVQNSLRPRADFGSVALNNQSAA